MSNEQMASALRLEKLSFENINYTRNVNAGTMPQEFEMNFNRQVIAHEDQKHFRVSLKANIWSKDDDTIKLEITLVGFFFCDCEDENLKNDLVNKNSIAILFPYLRSQISLVTTQPDMPPITLQPMNIVAMFDEAENENNNN